MLGRILWGAKWGLVFAAVLSLFPILAYVAGGNRAFDRHGVGLAAVLLVYAIGGVLTGMLVGVARPWVHHAPVAGVIGFVGGVISSALIRMSREGMPVWDREGIVVACLMGLFLGLPTGLIYREIFVAKR